MSSGVTTVSVLMGEGARRWEVSCALEDSFESVVEKTDKVLNSVSKKEFREGDGAWIIIQAWQSVVASSPGVERLSHDTGLDYMDLGFEDARKEVLVAFSNVGIDF